MCPTTKTARASQLPPDDPPNATRILLKIDMAVGVCCISEASANLPGPAGAKAMSVSNVLPWPARLVGSPFNHKKQKSTKIILGREKMTIHCIQQLMILQRTLKKRMTKYLTDL